MNSQTIYYGQNNLSMSLSKAYLVQTPVSSSKYRHVEKCRGSSYSRHHPTPFLMNNELTTASMSNSLLFTTADFQYALDPADSQVIKFETGLKKYLDENTIQQNYISSIHDSTGINQETTSTLVATKMSSQCCCAAADSMTLVDYDTMFTFNVNAASTPKNTKVKKIKDLKRGLCGESGCIECPMIKGKIVRACIEVDGHKKSSKKRTTMSKLKVDSKRFKKEVISSLESKKKIVAKLHNLTTSTKKVSISFTRHSKRTRESSNADHHVIKQKKNLSDRKKRMTDLLTKKTSTGYDAVDTGYLMSQYASDIADFGYSTSNSNKFYQLGQFQVWYV